MDALCADTRISFVYVCVRFKAKVFNDQYDEQHPDPNQMGMETSASGIERKEKSANYE